MHLATSLCDKLRRETSIFLFALSVTFHLTCLITMVIPQQSAPPRVFLGEAFVLTVKHELFTILCNMRTLLLKVEQVTSFYLKM